MKRKNADAVKPFEKKERAIQFYVVEQGKDRALRTKGFKKLGKQELVLLTQDVNQGVRLLSEISDKVLRNQITISLDAPIIGVLAVPLYCRSGFIDGEEVVILTTHLT